MINTYAAFAAKDLLTPYSYESKNLEPFDIEIAITHCGICHSDVHLIDNDWGISNYPLVPGHEIVGTVQAKGKQVTWLNKGQRIGVGWQCGSCMQCLYCRKGENNLCAKQKATCVSQFGGFAQSIITDARFAFVLPEELDSASTAPLFCGGATVYSPLRRFIHKPLMHVGVIGIGGLGHLAIQFANAFGCEVTAFSSSKDKEQEALKLGANQFVSSVDFRQLRTLSSRFDLIINTAPHTLEWPLFINMLKPKSFLCFVGVPQEQLNIPVSALIGGRRGVCGSNIASPIEIEDMLQLAAKHKLGAVIETFPLSKVNDAIAKVRSNTIRYRAVLEV